MLFVVLHLPCLIDRRGILNFGLTFLQFYYPSHSFHGVMMTSVTQLKLQPLLLLPSQGGGGEAVSLENFFPF